MLTTSLHLQLSGRFDLQIANALNEAAPDWVVYSGGNGSIIPLYCAYLLDQVGKSASLIHVVKDESGLPRKENVYYIEGDPLHGPDVLAQIKKMILPWHRVTVVLEEWSYHGTPLAQIQRYAPLVTAGANLVLDEGIQAFWEKQITFEPDWVRLNEGTYLRTESTESFGEASIFTTHTNRLSGRQIKNGSHSITSPAKRRIA